MYSIEKAVWTYLPDIIIILYMVPLFTMATVNRTYKITIAIAVLFGVSGIIFTNISPVAATTNQTSNQTGGNMTTTAGGGDQATAKMHLGEAIKALQAGDTAGAEMHMGLADQVLSGEAKMHLGEAIKALQAGDTAGAQTHAQLAQDSL